MDDNLKETADFLEKRQQEAAVKRNSFINAIQSHVVQHMQHCFQFLAPLTYPKDRDRAFSEGRMLMDLAKEITDALEGMKEKT